jgi:hypothetical protein
MTRTSDINDDMFLNFFIWGLKLEIRRVLLLSLPANLANAMDRTQLYEDRNKDLRGRFCRESPTPS